MYVSMSKSIIIIIIIVLTICMLRIRRCNSYDIYGVLRTYLELLYHYLPTIIIIIIIIFNKFSNNMQSFFYILFPIVTHN